MWDIFLIGRRTTRQKWSVKSRALVFFICLLSALFLQSGFGSSQEFELFDGYDIPGGDLSYPRIDDSLKDVSAEQCETRCRENPECKAFTYNTSAKWCFLKNAVGEKKPFVGAISGIARTSILEGFDLPGNDIALPDNDKSLRNLSLEECRARCLSHPACTAFTLNTSVNWCFLKGQAGERQVFADATSGVMRLVSSVVKAASVSDISAPNIGHRYALVIGNSAYQSKPLRNPVNDARDIADTLSNLGFDVTVKLDLDLGAFKSALVSFETELPDDAIALFFFAGHGVQFRGQNFFLPIGGITNVREAPDLFNQAIPLDEIINRLQTRKTPKNIVILDACRTSPFEDIVGIGSGLSRSALNLRGVRPLERNKSVGDAIQGTVISYSTSPNAVAEDGEGHNSPFTKHLKEKFAVPSASVGEILKQTAAAVSEETKGRQTPWYETSLTDDIYPGGRGRIEFRQLLEMFVPIPPDFYDWDGSGMLWSWEMGSQPGTPIEWLHGGVDLGEFGDKPLDNMGHGGRPRDWHIDNASWLEGREPDTELLWARYGTVAIVQNGRPVFTVLERELLPGRWGVALAGGKPGVFAVSFSSRYMTHEFNFFADTEYLTEIERCRISDPPYKQRFVYEVLLQERAMAWLGMFTCCGGNGGQFYDFLLVYSNDDRHRLLGCK